MSEVERWFLRLTSQHQRDLVLDPGRLLYGDLRAAVELARGRGLINDRLSPEEAHWVEMFAFGQRLGVLDEQRVAAYRTGLRDSDPVRYRELTRQFDDAVAHADKLFEGQADQIVARYQAERNWRHDGGGTRQDRGD